MSGENKLPLARCPRIEPDGAPYGYVCRTCGRELVVYGNWFRHTAYQRESPR